MNISVSKGIELMNVLGHISNCELRIKHPDIFELEYPYINQIKAKFGQYKDEPIVKLFEKLNFMFGAVSWGNILNDFYQVDKTKVAINMNDSLVEFFELLPEFAKKIEFDKYFQENQNFYNDITNDYAEFIQESKYEEFMKWFYKKDCTLDEERKFILMPSFNQVGMCLQNGKVCCASVQEIDEKGYPHFVSKEVFENKVPHTALHEYSHPIINVLTEKYFQEHQRFAIDNVVTKINGIYKNDDVINDTIIEAILAVYLERRGLLKYRQERILARKKAGFILVEPLADFLRKYTDNIDKYTSFSEFFPEIMEFLQSEVQKIFAKLV